MHRVRPAREIQGKHPEVLFLNTNGPVDAALTTLRRFFMASEDNPSARKHLRSKSLIITERRRHLRHYKHVIHPLSLLRYYWNILMISLMCLMNLVLPYQAAFDMYRHLPGWTIMKNTVLGFYLMDIFVNLITGFYDKTKRIVQLDPRSIIREYVRRGTFFLDVLGSIPTDIFFIHHWHTHIVLREITSLLITFRVVSAYSYAQHLARDLDVSIASLTMCSLLSFSILQIHWHACLQWIIPICIQTIKIPQQPQASSWISLNEVWAGNSFTKYCHSFLRAIATCTCSGYSGNPPDTAAEQYLAIIFEIIGIFLYCCAIPVLYQIYKGPNSSKLKYQVLTAQLKQYIRHKQLSSEGDRRFVCYYDFQFQKRYCNYREILKTLSPYIRQEISLHSCRKLVDNVTFFKDLPTSLLARIVTLLRSEVFLTNDIIMRANQPGDCMYFIASGTVAIYTKSGKEVCHLEDGAHFGEITLVIPNEYRITSVVAVEICELYRFGRADFFRTIHPYPILWERIKKEAITRYEQITILNS